METADYYIELDLKVNKKVNKFFFLAKVLLFIISNLCNNYI